METNSWSCCSTEWLRHCNPTFRAPVLNTTTAADSNTTLTFELTVSDSVGQTASARVNIFVNSSPGNAHHLKAIAGPDQTISAAGDTLSLTANGTVDAPYNIVGYKWVQIAGPSLAQLDQ